MPVWGYTYKPITADSTFPMTLTSGDSAVLLEDISFTSGLFVISGDHIILNGNGFNATWGTNYGDNQNGIYVNSLSDTVRITNLNLIHGGGYRSAPYDTSAYCDGIQVGSTDSLVIDSCYIMTTGEAGKCLNFDLATIKGVAIFGNELYDSSETYLRRDHYDAAVIRFDAYPDNGAPIAQWHANIHDNTLFGPHVGISNTYMLRLRVVNNTFNGDATNGLTVEGDPFQSSVNPYFLTFFRAAPGCSVYSNIVVSGSNREGCEGMLFECCYGTVDSPIVVMNNTMTLSNGPNGYNNTGQCKGIFVRGSGHFYTDIHDNDITITLDDDSGTDNIGITGFGIRLEHGIESYGCQLSEDCYHAELGPGERDSCWSSYNECHNNRVTFNTSGACSTQVFSFGNGEYSTGNEFYGNYGEGTNNLFSFGTTFGAANMGSMNAVAYSCTLNAIDGVPDDVFRVGRYSDAGEASTGNVARDFVYQGDITDWNDVTFWTNNALCEMRWERTLNILVLGQDSLPLENAVVSCVNAYGQTRGVDTTDANGFAYPVVTHWEENNNYGGVIDSTAYNPITIYITSGAYADTLSMTVTPTNYTDTSYMATAGTGLRPDSLVGFFAHASVGRYMLRDAWPYDNPFKWRLDSLVSTRSWPLNDQLYDFNWNATHGTVPYGENSATYTTGVEAYQNGYPLAFDFPLNGLMSGWMSQVNWWQDLGFWRDFFNETYNPRDTSYAWGKLMLPNIVWDNNGDSLIDTVNYDYIIMKTSYFWEDTVEQLINTFKTEVEAACDSAANYPNKVFGFWLGSPVEWGGGVNPSSGDRAACMQFDAWFRDTLETPANVVTWSFYHILVETSTDSANYGCLKTIYVGSGDHPNDLGASVLQDSSILWFDWFFDYLYAYYDTAQTPTPTPPTNLTSASIDSLHNDYSGNADSIRFIWQSGSQSFPDSIIFAYSTSGYPDSSSANRTAIDYVASTTDTAIFIFTMTEPCSLYVTYWVVGNDSGWSARDSVSAYFYYQAPSQPSQIASLNVDSVFTDYAGEADSGRVRWTTPAEAGNDSVIICWSLTAYPDSSNSNRLAIAYPGSGVTDTSFITFTLTETGYVYASAWVLDNVNGWSVRKTAYKRFVYTAPGVGGKYLRVFKGG